MMSPAGWEHGDIAGRLHALLGHHVISLKLGRIFCAETGFILARDPDTVRAPDIAFIASTNLPADKPQSAFWPGAPDLAVEVLSPDYRKGQVDAKIRDWFGAGVKAIWIVEPKSQSIAIYTSPEEFQTRNFSEALEGGELVPGFSCPVADIFG